MESLQGLLLSVGRLHFLRTHSLMGNTEVHHGQGGVLVSLHYKDGQTQKELADFLRVKPATMNVMIKRMEKNNIVRKEQDKEDHRTTRIYLTEKGEEELKKVEVIWNKLDNELFKNLSVEEKVILKRLLMQIRDNLLEEISQQDILCHNKKKK